MSSLRLLVAILVLVVPLSLAAAITDALVKPFREVSVSTAVPGVLESLQVREGARVNSGQTLGQLESSSERIEVERLAKILEKRRFDDEGTERLYAEDVVSEDEAIEVRIEREIAEMQLRRAEAELARRTLRAPLSGFIVALDAEAGEWIEPGDVVFEIVDIDQVFAEVLVTPEEARNVKVGTQVEVNFPLLGTAGSRSGRVDFIDPRVDASSGLMTIRVLLANPDHAIRPGYRGTVDLP